MAVRKEIGYQKKQRNSGIRERKRVLLLATEGKNKTEAYYFRSFAREHNWSVQFAAGNYTDPIQMTRVLKNAYKEMGLKEEEGDRAFCLVDTDVEPQKDQRLRKADQLVEHTNCELIASCPCFEVWYLCHFNASTKQYSSSADVVDELRKLYPSYRKNEEGLYEHFRKLTEDAIRNAKALEEHCRLAGYTKHSVESNPSTDVYIVAEEILKPAIQRCKESLK